MKPVLTITALAIAVVAGACLLPAPLQAKARIELAGLLVGPSEPVGIDDSLSRQALLARCVAAEAELRRWKPPLESLPPLVDATLLSAHVLLEGNDDDESLIETIEGAAASQWVVTAGRPHVDVGYLKRTSADDLLLSGRWLVGRIAATGRLSSSVESIRDEGFQQPVELVTSDGRRVRGGRGLLVGTGDGCRLDFIASDVAAAVGQWVVTTEGESVLICGRVVEATLQPGESHWSLVVEPVPRPRVGQTVAVWRRTANEALVRSGEATR